MFGTQGVFSVQLAPWLFLHYCIYIIWKTESGSYWSSMLTFAVHTSAHMEINSYWLIQKQIINEMEFEKALGNTSAYARIALLD